MFLCWLVSVGAWGGGGGGGGRMLGTETYVLIERVAPSDAKPY